MAIKASGTVAANAQLPRVNHDELADCHVLDPTVTRGADAAAAAAAAAWDAAAAATAAAVPASGQKLGLEPEKPPLEAEGPWSNCSSNQWTLTTPEVVISVGVIGPFEEGYLREEVSTRTFNLDVQPVGKAAASPAIVQGIINGDMNGLFIADATYNYAPDTRPGHEGALTPVAQPHGQVQEVTAPNVAQLVERVASGCKRRLWAALPTRIQGGVTLLAQRLWCRAKAATIPRAFNAPGGARERALLQDVASRDGRRVRAAAGPPCIHSYILHMNVHVLHCAYAPTPRAGCGAVPCMLVPPLPSPHALCLQSLRVILRANGGQSDAGNDQLHP